MLDKLKAIENRFQEINQQLEETGEDYMRAMELSKERAELEPVIQKATEYHHVLESIEEARSLENSQDEEMQALAHG